MLDLLLARMEVGRIEIDHAGYLSRGRPSPPALWFGYGE